MLVLPRVVKSRCITQCYDTSISASSALEYGSVPGSPSTIRAGTVDEDKYGSLLNSLDGALAKATQRRGDQRTAAGGKQGAHKHSVS